MSSRLTNNPLNRQSLSFAGYVVICVLLYVRPIWQLLQLALSHDTYSHILIVPLVTIGLVWMRPQRLGERAGRSLAPAGALLLAGALLAFSSWRYDPQLPEGWPPALTILSLLCLVWAGVLLLYGSRVFRSLLFPLLFLLLAVPLPQAVIDRFILWLQIGSAEVTYFLFRVTGTPVLRQKFLFFVPRFTIEIAKECSGIRSAVALLITCLLAGYLFLRSGWARTALLVTALPVLVIKNGIRIVTLTLLSIYVDPGFLSGDLHREGGFLFFLIGLVILWPVLWGLQIIEARLAKADGRPPGKLGGGSRISPAAMLPHS